MNDKTANHYHITLKVQNMVGVMARISILLRKFNVNITSMNISHLDEDERFFELNMEVDSQKPADDFTVVINKLERLVPVVEIEYKKIS